MEMTKEFEETIFNSYHSRLSRKTCVVIIQRYTGHTTESIESFLEHKRKFWKGKTDAILKHLACSIQVKAISGDIL